MIAAKLRPPRLRAGALVRDDLLARLDETRGRHVVVRAPAGYGKTTLVRQWVERAARPWAWVTADRGDDDPIVLYRHVVAALEPIGPLPRARRLAIAGRAWEQQQGLVALAADLADVAPFVLVLDDAQEITAEASIDFLDRLLDVVADDGCVVIATRADPGVRRARRLLDGTIVELRADDLRLDPPSSARLLRRSCPDLDDETVELAVARCDGWVAGVAFVGLALDGATDARTIASGLSHADRPIAEYLRDEVLGHLAPDERAFLVRSSVLDTLTAPLCDAVVERVGSHDVLEAMASSGNLFVAGFDDGGASYRYHALWRELLLAELRSSDPDAEAALRRRAAAWLDAHGEVDDAIVQLLAAGDREEAARLIGQQLAPCVVDGRVATLWRWLQSFDADEIHASPALLLAGAWVATFSGTADETLEWLRRLDAFPRDTRLPDGTTVATGRAAVEMVGGHGAAKGTVLAADVLVDAGPEHNPWWATARVVGTAARYQTGEFTDPDAALEAVERDVSTSPGLHALALTHRAFLRFRAGRPADAHPFVARAVADLREGGLEDYPPMAVVHAIHALDAACTGDPAVPQIVARTDGLIAGARGMSARGRGHTELLVADALLVFGDLAGARHHLGLAVANLRDEPDATLFADYADELVERLGAVAAGAGMVDRLSAAELRVLEQLPTHRSLREIAEQLYVSRNTVKTQTISVYRKLGVSNRSDAVTAARALGLLDP